MKVQMISLICVMVISGRSSPQFSLARDIHSNYGLQFISQAQSVDRDTLIGQRSFKSGNKNTKHWVVQIETVNVSSVGEGCASCFDDRRDRLLILAESAPSSRSSAELSEFDFSKQELRRISVAGKSPAGYFLPTVAIDSKQDALYLFGGWPRGANVPSDEMYQLNLTHKPLTWIRLSPKSKVPPPRNGATMIVDAHSNSLLLFGGDGGPGRLGFTPLDDLWRYDLVKGTWDQLRASGDKPPARWHAMMAIDDTSRRAYLFGGAGFGPDSTDDRLYELNLNSYNWRIIKAWGDSPPSLQGGTLTFDPEYKALLLVGGLRHKPPGKATCSDIWILDIRHAHWERVNGAKAIQRRDHVGTYDPLTQSHYIFGGKISTKIGDFYERGKRVRSSVRIKIHRRI